MSRPTKEDLQAKIVQLETTVDRLRNERRALLNVKSTDGLLSSEWLLRTAKAEAITEAYKKANDELSKSAYVQPEFGALFTKHENLTRSVETAIYLLNRGDRHEALRLLSEALDNDSYPG